MSYIYSTGGNMRSVASRNIGLLGGQNDPSVVTPQKVLLPLIWGVWWLGEHRQQTNRPINKTTTQIQSLCIFFQRLAGFWEYLSIFVSPPGFVCYSQVQLSQFHTTALGQGVFSPVVDREDRKSLCSPEQRKASLGLIGPPCASLGLLGPPCASQGNVLSAV